MRRSQQLLIFLLFLIVSLLSLTSSEPASLEDYITSDDVLYESENQEMECIGLGHEFFTLLLYPHDPLNSSITESCFELSVSALH